MTEPVSFAAWLRRERERRNIALRSIAERTKIGIGLLQALERGDVSRWPGGIYRRSFVRAYSEAVGLDPDLVVANFERAFPDTSTGAPEVPAAPAAHPVDEADMRLLLVAPAVPSVPPAAVRDAAVDLAVIAAVAVVGYLVSGWTGFWCGAALAAIAYHLGHVLGLRTHIARLGAVRDPRLPPPRPVAQVVNFSEQQARSSRRARAKRMIADLSAAAASLPRKRAARS